MILEIVTVQIKPGHEADYETAFAKASRYLMDSKGYISHQVQRCVETKGRYVILVQWESIDDHMIGFRESPAFQEYRQLVSPYFESPSQMAHYELVQKNP
jgi:heme-degrading monooxygenase HmoA